MGATTFRELRHRFWTFVVVILLCVGTYMLFRKKIKYKSAETHSLAKLDEMLKLRYGTVETHIVNAVENNIRCDLKQNMKMSIKDGVILGMMTGFVFNGTLEASLVGGIMWGALRPMLVYLNTLAI